MSNGHAARACRVLIVDDEHIIADTLGLIFHQSEYETLVAYCGREAIEAARSFRPDFVVSDVVMPDVDGIEVAIQVMRDVPSCRVLLMSGQTTADQLFERARRGGYDFPLVAKPIHPSALLERVASLIKDSQRTLPKVLNVDDNDIQRYAVSRMLKAAGYEVWEAATGEQALQLASRQPNVIVLDLNLPDINGFEVCRALKQGEATSHIPVIHLTNTYRDEAALRKSRESGADVYLTHPVQPDDLLSQMAALMKAEASRE